MKAAYFGQSTCFSPSSHEFDSQRTQKNFKGKIIDVAQVNQPPLLEERGQWLEDVDQIHLALASRKPELQKNDTGTTLI